MHRDDNTDAKIKTLAALRAVGEIEILRFRQLNDDLRQLHVDGVIEARVGFRIASIHFNAAKAALRFLVGRRGKRS